MGPLQIWLKQDKKLKLSRFGKIAILTHKYLSRIYTDFAFQLFPTFPTEAVKWSEIKLNMVN